MSPTLAFIVGFLSCLGAQCTLLVLLAIQATVRQVRAKRRIEQYLMDEQAKTEAKVKANLEDFRR